MNKVPPEASAPARSTCDEDERRQDTGHVAERRHFVAVLTAGLLAWPRAATAQPSAMPAIGYLSGRSLVGGDPVTAGLVASYNHPGGNATGINILATTLEAKRLQLLHEVMPQAAAIGFLVNPKFPTYESQLKDAQEGARLLGVRIHVLRANTDGEIDAAFETVARQRIAALAVAANPFFDTRLEKLVGLATRRAVPAIYHLREYVKAGGLMSYGVDLREAYRQVGAYTGRILKGAKPSDLPVIQPTTFELVVSMKAAKALGVNVPPSVLLQADEVIR